MAANAGDNTISARTDVSSGTENGGTAATALRLGHVILHVPDVPAAVAFYQAAFGLACRFVHLLGYAEMETGMTALAFASHKLTEANGLPPSPYGRPFGAEVAFVTSDVTRPQRTLRAGAEAVFTPAARPWGQVVGYMRNLNGFLVELCGIMYQSPLDFGQVINFAYEDSFR